MVMKQETGSQDVALHVTGKDVEQQDWVLPWEAPGFGWPKEMTEARLGPPKTCLEYVKNNRGACRQRLLKHEKDARAVEQLANLYSAL